LNPKAGDAVGLFQVVEPDMEQVDALITQVVQDENPLVERVAAYLREAAGKRIRPALVLLSGRAVDRPSVHLVPIATAVELIHMATLVHDDIIDRAELRRGKPAVRRAFNDQVAVLAGDFLFARAFQLLAETGIPAVVRTAADVVHTMSVGEIRQNLDRGRVATEDEYLLRIEAKTATFLAASCRLGALAVGADALTLEALTAYGWHVGMAFQLIDDLLDVTADPATLGKAVAADFQQGIVTLPVMYALAHSTRARDLEAMLSAASGDTAVDEIHALLEEAGAIQYVRDKADHMVRLGLEALAPLRPSDARDALEALARFVVAREY
jgi:heptaprenyl diphosphate synthase